MLMRRRAQGDSRMISVLGVVLLMAPTPGWAQQQVEPPQAGMRDTATGEQPVAGDEAGDDAPVAVSRDGLIEMHCQGLDLYTVLQQLLLKTRKNIIFGPQVGGAVNVSLYNVTLDQALDAILLPNGYGYREEGNFIYIYTQEQLRELRESERPVETQTYRLNYISPGDAAILLDPLLTPDVGRIITGPGAGESASGSEEQRLAIEDLIIIQDYRENLARIEQQLALIDKRPKQVLVEATIVRATLNESNALGIDFNILCGVDFDLLAAAGGIATPLQKGPNFLGPGVVGGSDFGNVSNTVPLSKLDDLTFSASTEFAKNVPPGGLSLGIVTDNVSMFLRALESVSDVAVIANPKVLALNKQDTHVLVGARDGYVTSLVTTETASTQDVGFLETGTQLRFKPFISNDGYVRMEVTPSDSTGGVDARGLPFERTTEVTTNILVKDGHTILIGGLFREADGTGRSQIPLLGSIPVVGHAFRSTNDSTVREEVIILLTVHVIDDEQQYAEYSDALLDDVERLRVGIREGMMFTGRERLAQANFHSALEYASAKNWDLALWHVKLAIHNRPSFVEAIKLREEILRERAWDEDGTASSSFVRKLILREQGLSPQVFGRPLLPEVPDTAGVEEAAEDDIHHVTPVDDGG